jgi:hypothetical protein
MACSSRAGIRCCARGAVCVSCCYAQSQGEADMSLGEARLRFNNFSRAGSVPPTSDWVWGVVLLRRSLAWVAAFRATCTVNAGTYFSGIRHHALLLIAIPAATFTLGHPPISPSALHARCSPWTRPLRTTTLPPLPPGLLPQPGRRRRPRAEPSTPRRSHRVSIAAPTHARRNHGRRRTKEDQQHCAAQAARRRG